MPLQGPRIESGSLPYCRYQSLSCTSRQGIQVLSLLQCSQHVFLACSLFLSYGEVIEGGDAGVGDDGADGDAGGGEISGNAGV